MSRLLLPRKPKPSPAVRFDLRLVSACLHDDDLTEIKTSGAHPVLLTVSKDMCVRMWTLPEFWPRTIQGQASEACKYELQTEYLSDGDSDAEED